MKELHRLSDPLLIANVWDVNSAKIAEDLKFKAIGTSSAAMATMLGYRDGEEMSFQELVYLVERIKSCTALPLTVDLESGYADNPSAIVDNIEKLVDLGVVGVNIEDSVVEKERKQLQPETFAETLLGVRKNLDQRGVKMFLNIRTDSFLLGLEGATLEALKRIPLYEEAGADGIFVPFMEREEDIERIVQSTSLPVNVLGTPNLPDFEKLKKLGVRRISMGNSLFDRLQTDYSKLLRELSYDKTFKPVF